MKWLCPEDNSYIVICETCFFTTSLPWQTCMQLLQQKRPAWQSTGNDIQVSASKIQ